MKYLEYLDENVLSPKVPSDKRISNIENDFYADNSILRKNFYIGINNELEKIRIYYNGSPYADEYKNFSPYISTYSFKQILGVEIIEDEVSISKTNRKSQIVGTGIGAAVAGSTGALIGGLSGKSLTRQEVQTIALRVIVDDYDNPVYDFPFLNQKDTIKKSSNIYKNAIKETYRWHNIITKIINEDTNEKISESVEETITTNINYVKEVERIVSLKNKGLITEDEFNMLKNKLIN